MNPLHCHRKKATFTEAKSTSFVMLLADASSTAEDSRGRARNLSCAGRVVAYFKISGEGVENANEIGHSARFDLSRLKLLTALLREQCLVLMKNFI
jgi:hypothetical protein